MGQLMTNLQKLKGAFARGLGLSESKITNNLEYNTIQEWDSVGHMALVAEIENEFEIMIDTQDVIDMSSFGKAKEIIQKYDVNINA